MSIIEFDNQRFDDLYQKYEVSFLEQHTIFF